MKRLPENVNKNLFKGDQLKVFNGTLKFFRKTGGGFLLVKGKAGTGKTYIVQRIIEQLLFQSYGRVCMLAPTGQAVKICRDSADYYNTNLSYATLHSAFGLIPKKDGDKLIFVKNSFASVLADRVDVLFIDEVSQLEDRLFFLLMDKVEDGMKVILIGDEHQVPPINHNNSIPFTKDGLEDFDIEATNPKRWLSYFFSINGG
jgi:ATP-dependent exoDNAse (exonuclease V) alpha subunit